MVWLRVFGGVMSIRDIAKRAGVSPATVSRVLNDPRHRCSSEGVRERIWRIAREMNYLPNEAARSLKTGAATTSLEPRCVDVLVTRASNRQMEPFFVELLHAVEAESQQQRCIISNSWSLPSPSTARLSRLGEHEFDAVLSPGSDRADGLVVLGKCDSGLLERLCDAYDGNVVCVGRNSVGQRTDEILCDGEQLARIAVEHLISLGHTAIGYVGNCRGETRCRGYQRTLLDHDLDPQMNAIIECDHTEGAGYAVMRQLMQDEAAPTAIFCATDSIALGMLRCLGQLGGRYYAPSIISCDDIEEAQYAIPTLTTVALPKRDMGRFALRLLTDRMAGGHTAVARVELFGRLVVRESCSLPSDANGYTYVI